MQFIDLKSRHLLIKDQINARIQTVMEHGQFILGPEVRELEQKLAEYTGSKHCITVSSGTDSLLIALMALGVGPGDEIITVPYTWISSAEVIALLGAKPVFVDIRPDTWNMDERLLEAAISEKTKAIMPVSIYGQTPDMDAINEVASRHEIPVIEDAAQSFGATYKGRKSCNLSSIGSTSFFPSKPLGCYGDAGALFTDNDEWAEKFRWIRVHGQERKHHHPILGLNGRMDTIQAAILLSVFDVFPEEVEKRREIGDRYNSSLSDIDGLATPVIAPGNSSVYAQYTILSGQRECIQNSLEEQGIPSVSYYSVPLHLQPVFSDLGCRSGDFPVSEKIANECLSLPMGPYLSDGDQNKVLEGIRDSATASSG
ncbi:DegT/DnrJ/EryC1/StrS family aminotransferase [Opitutales bacterium]|jgi:UDP-2-acetamido-2-deoxy-ribo-hexuluronate aminotransferase|nr:DegT/DnrJ/EryC1/StrS family aminotransferase [Opitutales bacterium]